MVMVEMVLGGFVWHLNGPNSDLGDFGNEKYGLVLGCGRFGDKLELVLDTLWIDIKERSLGGEGRVFIEVLVGLLDCVVLVLLLY